jgi:DNA-binding XRE family transcriptional regulator
VRWTTLAAKRAGLVRARVAVGLTQEEFANAIGVDRSTVHRWESAANAPLPYLHAKIARTLRLSLSEFEDLLSDRRSVDRREHEWETLATVSDSAIETDLRIVIDIAEDGNADVQYYHEVKNLSKLPLTRFRRDLWFEKTAAPLKVTAIPHGEHRLMIQPIHFTPSLAKFACQIAPNVQPGGSATFGYRCTGGLFAEDHYWREVVTRYTRKFSIQVTQRGVTRLAACNAVVEHPDGRENSAAEELTWREGEGVITLNLQQEFLLPNHALALRWDIERSESA